MDDEFYGEVSSSFRPFPSLESLTFENMPSWEFWFPFSNRDAGALQPIFPCLVELNIWKCPKLSFELIHPCLPSIVKLDVRGCLHMLLYFEFPFLRELKVTDMIGWRRGIHIDLHSLTALTKLTVKKIPELSRMGEWLPLEVEYLKISDCDSLEELPNGLHRLQSLKELRIGHCPRLVSFPETGLPPVLRVLVLYACEGLKLIPDGRYNSSLHFLERLEVEDCPSLVCFPDMLPSTLKQLVIRHCINLKALPDGIMQSSASSSSSRGISHLEVLIIEGCQSLKTIPTGNFPSSLKRLDIWNCELLEPISGQMLCNNAALEYLCMWNYPNLRTLVGCLDSLANLINLTIVDCPGLEFFPKSGLPNANLKELWIDNCKNLGSLPPQMQNLTSLQELHVSRCPRLVSLPEGGLAPNLTSLWIEYCRNLQTHLSDWGLQRLTSLKTFRISDACLDVVSFHENERPLVLPRNLAKLYICRLENLESLAFLGLQNLNSLEVLCIGHCPKLQSFLPEEGLPATLSRLEINRCPLLKRRCCSKKGEDWPKISHIPRISIDFDMNSTISIHTESSFPCFRYTFLITTHGSLRHLLGAIFNFTCNKVCLFLF